MARISTYPVDLNPEGADILLGTDATGGTNATKNFRISDISVTFINQYLANNSWLFTTDATDAPFRKASMYFAAGAGNNTAWSAISTIRVQTLMGNNSSSHPYLDFLLTNDPTGVAAPVDNTITIADRNDLSSFGVFTFTSSTLVAGETTIYDIVLSFEKGSGAIQEKHEYGISLEDASAASGTFEFTQPVPSASWSIQHDLGKFPSVSVVNNNNILMYGDTEYIDNNNIIITFSGGFSGKAYLN